MKPILLILSFLYSHIAFSQGVVVAADKMNVLYIGIENPMSIAAENYSCKDLVVEISQGTITKDEDYSCRHIAKVTTPGKATIIIKNKNGKILSEVVFRVKRVPDPTAIVAGIENGSVVSKSRFKGTLGVTAVLLGFDLNITYKTISYDLVSFNAKRKTFFFETNEGALFNERIKEMMKNIEDGDVISPSLVLSPTIPNLETCFKITIFNFLLQLY